MISSFDKFIENKELKLTELSIALFSCRNCTAICENTQKDDPEEGKNYFIDFLNFIIKQFKRIIHQNSKSSIETKLRAFELKSFIFNFMVEDLIVSVARNFGTKELSEVHHHNLDLQEPAGQHEDLRPDLAAGVDAAREVAHGQRGDHPVEGQRERHDRHRVLDRRY